MMTTPSAPAAGAFGYQVRRVAAPAMEPLTLAEVKEALRVTHNDDDAMIQRVISSARESVEDRWSFTAIRTRLRVSFESCASCRVLLPKGPSLSVAQVTASPVSGEGAPFTVSPSAYTHRQEADVLFLDVALYGHLVTVEYDAGFGDSPESVPYAVKQAILLYVHAMYETPGGVAISVPPVVSALLAPYMAFRI